MIKILCIEQDQADPIHFRCEGGWGLVVRALNDTVLDIISGICDDMISFYNFFMAD